MQNGCNWVSKKCINYGNSETDVRKSLASASYLFSSRDEIFQGLNCFVDPSVFLNHRHCFPLGRNSLKVSKLASRTSIIKDLVLCCISHQLANSKVRISKADLGASYLKCTISYQYHSHDFSSQGTIEKERPWWWCSWLFRGCSWFEF